MSLFVSWKYNLLKLYFTTGQMSKKYFSVLFYFIDHSFVLLSLFNLQFSETKHKRKIKFYFFELHLLVFFFFHFIFLIFTISSRSIHIFITSLVWFSSILKTFGNNKINLNLGRSSFVTWFNMGLLKSFPIFKMFFRFQCYKDLNCAVLYSLM